MRRQYNEKPWQTILLVVCSLGITEVQMQIDFSRKVKKYLEKHKDTLKPVYLPTASPKFMVLEECWNISKDDHGINIRQVIYGIQNKTRGEELSDY